MVFLGQKSEGRGRQGAQVNFLGSGEIPPNRRNSGGCGQKWA